MPTFMTRLHRSSLPITWVELVYWICFRPLHYWRFVQPHLADRVSAWLLIVQTGIGAAIISSVLFIPPLFVIWRLPPTVTLYRDLLFQSLVFTISVPLLFGIITGGLRGPAFGLIFAGASISYAFSASISVSTTLGIVLLLPFPEPHIPVSFSFVLPNMTAFGFAFGVIAGLTEVQALSQSRFYRHLPHSSRWHVCYGILWIGLLILIGASGTLSHWRYRGDQIWYIVTLIAQAGAILISYLVGVSPALRVIATQHASPTSHVL
jgi:hypothetical protein